MRAALVALCLLAGAAAAQTERKALGAAELGAFAAVGRLYQAADQFCSATLISAREVLTAAHCLYDARTGQRVALDALRFVPGNDGPPAAVARAVTAPEFALLEAPTPEALRTDIALLELAETARPAPFVVAEIGAATRRLDIVSYAVDATDAPARNGRCVRLGQLQEVLIVNCGILPGMSGAPVLEGDRIVAVVSAMRQRNDGMTFGVTVLAAPWIEALRRDLAAQRP